MQGVLADSGPVNDLQEPKDKMPVAPSTAIGIDQGISDFAITSDGVNNPVGLVWLARQTKQHQPKNMMVHYLRVRLSGQPTPNPPWFLHPDRSGMC